VVLYDNCGRPTLNLRVSLTQRCNLRCPYCHREGQIPTTSGVGLREMTAQEIIRLVRIAVELGINKVKLTGGEPLLRNDIVQIVSGLAKIEGLRDLSMTSNGTHLATLAKPLYEAGLKRININLPSLNMKTYAELNGGDLNDVLNGVGAAVKAGLNPVKLNMLILNGVNEHEIGNMKDFARKSGAILQLLELEPVNVKDPYYRQFHYPIENIEEELKKQALDMQVRGDMQSRHIYSLPNGLQLEVVHPIENSQFCARCTRLRITSDGHLKPCLMVYDNSVDVLTPIRKGATDDELKGLFMAAVKRRIPYFRPLTN
jgi:cyclic pyranopterin phosphate synthase